MRKQKTRRNLKTVSILLTLIVLVATLGIFSLTASAEDACEHVFDPVTDYCTVDGCGMRRVYVDFSDVQSKWARSSATYSLNAWHDIYSQFTEGTRIEDEALFEKCIVAFMIPSSTIKMSLTASDNGSYYMTDIVEVHESKNCYKLTRLADTSLGSGYIDYTFDGGWTTYGTATEHVHTYVNGFCTEGDSIEAAALNEDGYYEISNAGQLYWFAGLVNSGNSDANAILLDHIKINESVLDASGELISNTDSLREWTVIGISAYHGVFDGNNKTVSGVYIKASTNDIGFFGQVAGTVKNLGVIDSYYGNTGDSTGGITGSLSSYGTIQNCYFDGQIYNTLGSATLGGIVGYAYDGCTIINCFNYGRVTSTNCDYKIGAVVGYVSGDINIQNCYYLSGCTVANSVIQNGIGRISSAEAHPDAIGVTEAKSAEVFASGEVAYLLGTAWGQTIGTDEYPAFKTESNTVYKKRIGACTDSSFIYAYTNTESDDMLTHSGGTATCTAQAVCENCGESYGELDPNNHEYEKNNGICCDTYQPAELNEGGYYEIGNAGQLFWYANHINTVDRTANAVLTADIDLESRPWTPIGSTGENSNNFRGAFDGQNHTIRGLYVVGGRAGLGFFGEVRTGTVRNFTIYGEVVANTEVDYVGGVIGSICGVNGEHDLERNGAVIQNITSYVNLTAKAHGVGKIGGLVGYANHESLIENCSWYGTFDAGIYRVDNGAGGFIGRIQENTSKVTIRNCAAYGTIKTDYVKNSFNNTPTIYIGGFLSFSNTGAQTTLENCLFAGKLERGENLTDEAFLGAFGTLRSVNFIKNCYYLGDDGLEAVHSDSNLKPGSDNNVEITRVTKAQLLSGEIAYKLGEAYGQTLTGENRQSYPVLGGESVPSSRFEIYGQQLNLGRDLSMKYYVMGYAPELDTEKLTMQFILNDDVTVAHVGYQSEDGFYIFILDGINPQCMGDNIAAQLMLDGTVVATMDEYSVKKYAARALELFSDDTALVQLISDMLYYGAAAQVYKSYKTDTLVTEGLTLTPSTILPELSDNAFVLSSTVTEGNRFTEAGVRFSTDNKLYVRLNADTDVKLVVKLDGTTVDTVSYAAGDAYSYYTDGIVATGFGYVFTFELYNGEELVQSLDYSVNTYAYRMLDSENAAMAELTKALYRYGKSAVAYAQ